MDHSDVNLSDLQHEVVGVGREPDEASSSLRPERMTLALTWCHDFCSKKKYFLNCSLESTSKIEARVTASLILLELFSLKLLINSTL